MRVISDFDGVLTAQEGEAEAVGERQLQLLAAAAGSEVVARALVDEYRLRVRAEPARHGWRLGGHLSCFADEDPYVFHTAVSEVLYEFGPRSVVDRLISQGMADSNAFAGRCFLEGTEAWRAANGSHLDPLAVDLFAAFAGLKADVTVVSNSSTSRIESILADFGRDRFDGFVPSVRGGAQKFVITDDIDVPVPDTAAFGPRSIGLRRGHYWRILDEIRPAMVVGDVLSLDLALPVTLRDQVPGFEDMKICFRRAAHTPAWALAAARDRGIHVVDSLMDLPGILSG